MTEGKFSPWSSSSSSLFSSRKLWLLLIFLFVLVAFVPVVSVFVFDYVAYSLSVPLSIPLLRQSTSSNADIIHDSIATPISSISSASKSDIERIKIWSSRLPFAEGSGGCNYFSGRWVKDELNRPLYSESECPYIHSQLTCQEHGRPDKDYQLWRWQPHGCLLPRFNATKMLEALRGKRMLFVGDSLGRGQFASMVCLVQSTTTSSAKSLKASYASLTVFTAKDYNATIEFYWAPFLLESNSDDSHAHKVNETIVREWSINTHGKFWEGADIVVFNTYLWWMTRYKFKILKGSFEDKVKINTELMIRDDAYRMSMKSLVIWIEKNMDPQKTRVFFTSMSPTHTRSSEWGGDPDGNCYNQTKMIEDTNYWSPSASKTIMQVTSEELSKSRVPIAFLNITQLSGYRKDAHTTIYKKQWRPITAEQLANPITYADCVHWCLPGLHDTLQVDVLPQLIIMSLR